MTEENEVELTCICGECEIDDEILKELRKMDLEDWTEEEVEKFRKGLSEALKDD